MSALQVETPPVTPAKLAYILGDDAVLVAARRLLAAKQKRQALYAVPKADTSMNGQPWTRAMHEANTNAQEAVRALADAADRAAERLVREEPK